MKRNLSDWVMQSGGIHSSCTIKDVVFQCVIECTQESSVATEHEAARHVGSRGGIPTAGAARATPAEDQGLIRLRPPVTPWTRGQVQLLRCPVRPAPAVV
jgi:hypothetical protein